MNAIELVVFDWDGTLVDSTARIVDCLQRAAQATGLPELAAADYRGIIGLGLPEALATLYPRASAGERQQLREHYAHFYIAADDAAPNAPYAGAVALLEALRGRGARLAVATGKNRPGLARAFRGTGLGHYFHASRTADETASKPDPRMLHELLRELDVAPAAAVMVGDTTFDLDMARDAGVHAIGITHGAHDVARLRASQPLALVDDIPALGRLLLPRVSTTNFFSPAGILP